MYRKDFSGAREALPAWVGFNGFGNPDWVHKNTTVWPVQKLTLGKELEWSGAQLLWPRTLLQEPHIVRRIEVLIAAADIDECKRAW